MNCIMQVFVVTASILVVVTSLFKKVVSLQEQVHKKNNRLKGRCKEMFAQIVILSAEFFKNCTNAIQV